MKSKKQSPPTEISIPVQVKLTAQTRDRLKTIATKNGLSLNDVGTMAIAAGLNIVAMKLGEIHEPAAKAA